MILFPAASEDLLPKRYRFFQICANGRGTVARQDMATDVVAEMLFISHQKEPLLAGAVGPEPVGRLLPYRIGRYDRMPSVVKLARRITVHGMVQGVGFRMFVQRCGQRHGLTGDVRNLRDSTVEIVAEGAAQDMEEFIKEVRNGPPMAHVERLEIREISPAGHYPTFMIEGF